MLELPQILFPGEFDYSRHHISACLETSAISRKLNRSWDYGAINGQQFSLQVEPTFVGILYLFVPDSGAYFLAIFLSFFVRKKQKELSDLFFFFLASLSSLGEFEIVL